MRVSVVIPHYFAQREENLPTIVRSHVFASRPPDEILIWNNDKPLSVELDQGFTGAVIMKAASCRVIQSPWNLGCKARFLAALVAVGDWILFQDNDLTPEAGALEDLLAWAQKYPTAILSFEGRRIQPNRPYRVWNSIRGLDQRKPQRIDITLGRMELVRRDVLMKILDVFPFRDDTEMDDLAFSACARKLDVKCFAVPYTKGTGFVRLSEHGVGISVTNRREYLEKRDRVVREWGLRAG